jgi:ribonuclease BN (tRNA processing enzyme)
MQKVIFTLLLVSYCVSVSFAQTAAPTTATSKTQIVMLGTGNPNADPDRSGPATAIIVNGSSYIIDSGPGVVRRASAAAKKYNIPALQSPNLKIVFITHLHSDHTVGLPDLIFTSWVLGRAEPLQVYGPPGVRSMTEHLEAAYAEDIRIRTTGGEPGKTTGYKVDAHEVTSGQIYKDANVTVTAFQIKHGAWNEKGDERGIGYMFQTADRKIVISGDTAPTDAVVKACNGCDVLIHEVYSQAAFAIRPPEWKAYSSRFHTSSVELAKIAADAKPGLLVLYHQGLRGQTEESLLAEIKQTYSGKVVSAHDLDIY